MALRVITDEALVLFVRWCRENDATLVTNPDVARRVFNAYRLLRPYPAEQPTEQSHAQ